MNLLAIALIILGTAGLTAYFIHERHLGPWKYRKSLSEKLNLPNFFLGPASLILVWLGLMLGFYTKLFHF